MRATMPYGPSAFSNTSTSRPLRRRNNAAAMPAGPAPMTATRATGRNGAGMIARM